MRELMKSINTMITNLIKRDLARVRKSGKCYIIPLPRLIYIYTDLFTLTAFNCVATKASSEMFDWVLITSLLLT